MSDTVEEQHALMVKSLIKDPNEIGLDLRDLALMHDLYGITGEVGELVDAIKKHTIYGKTLDLDNIIEELGDLEFYLQDLRTNLGLTREQTLVSNMEKLAKRYPNFNYTDARALARADKISQPQNG